MVFSWYCKKNSEPKKPKHMKRDLELLIFTCVPAFMVSIGITAVLSGLIKNDTEFMYMGLIFMMVPLYFLHLIKISIPAEWEKFENQWQQLWKKFSEIGATRPVVSSTAPVSNEPSLIAQLAVKTIPTVQEFHKNVDTALAESKMRRDSIEYFESEMNKYDYTCVISKNGKYITVTLPGTQITKTFSDVTFTAPEKLNPVKS